MKPPSFSGKGSVRTFLAKFDNCVRYNRWLDREKLHYLTNALEDPAAQVLRDLQSDEAMSYRELRSTLVRSSSGEEHGITNKANSRPRTVKLRSDFRKRDGSVHSRNES